MHRIVRACLITILGFTAAVPAAFAEERPYPNRPIRFIVPFGPGGGGDTVARIVGQELSRGLGATVVIDNRPGAGATMGTDIAAKSNADGYTILLGNVGPLAIAPSLYKNVPYDAQRDFVPVSLLVIYPNILVVHPSVPSRTVKGLVALAKKRPGDLSFASAGNGSSTHLAGEMFKSMAGIDIVHVPYKRSGQAVTDLIAGQVHMYFSSVVGALPHMKGGRLVALAVSSAKRSKIAPAVPTMAESGFPDFEADNWLGVVTPKGTPKPIVARLNHEIAVAMQRPDVEKKLLARGAEVAVGSPESFARYIGSETRKWSKVVAESGARVD